MSLQNAVVECLCGANVHVPFGYESKCPKCLRRIRKTGDYYTCFNNNLNEGTPVPTRFTYHPATASYFEYVFPDSEQEIMIIFSDRSASSGMWGKKAQDYYEAHYLDDRVIPVMWIPLIRKNPEASK